MRVEIILDGEVHSTHPASNLLTGVMLSDRDAKKQALKTAIDTKRLRPSEVLRVKFRIREDGQQG